MSNFELFLEAFPAGSRPILETEIFQLSEAVQKLWKLRGETGQNWLGAKDRNIRVIDRSARKVLVTLHELDGLGHFDAGNDATRAYYQLWKVYLACNETVLARTPNPGELRAKINPLLEKLKAIIEDMEDNAEGLWQSS